MEIPDDDPIPGRCNASTRDDTPCRKYPVADGTRCRFHGGASTGPADTSHLVDNEFAVDNDGGPPELNMNAAVANGAFSDLNKLEARLTGAALHAVARETWLVIKASRARRPDLAEDRRCQLARRYGLLTIQWHQAALDLGDRGFTLERTRTVDAGDGEAATISEPAVNPTWPRARRVSAEQRRLGNTLGLYDAPANGDGNHEKAD